MHTIERKCCRNSGQEKCFWAWWTWREDLIKEAGHEQVIEGESAFGSFSWGKWYEEQGGDVLFITAAQDTNSWVDEWNDRWPTLCSGIGVRSVELKDWSTWKRWEIQLAGHIGCEPDHGGSGMPAWGNGHYLWGNNESLRIMSREGHDEISFSRRWIWQWCARSAYQLITRRKKILTKLRILQVPRWAVFHND